MKKKYLFVLVLLVLVLSLTGCGKKAGKDALKFKEDYESLNDKETSSGTPYRKISIPEDNPIEYSTFKDIKEKIDNKEDFVMYVGFSACPWCRSVITPVLEVFKENKVKTVYYVNVRSDNTKETDIRGYYKLDEKDKVVVDVEKGEYYDDILSALSEFLTPYTLKNSKGKVIGTGENRLYAPTFVVFKKGAAVALDECISDNQNDAYMELTEDIIKDIKDKATKLIKNYNE